MILFSFKGVKSTNFWRDANSNNTKINIKAMKPQKMKPKDESSQPRDSVSKATPNRFPSIFIKMNINRQRTIYEMRLAHTCFISTCSLIKADNGSTNNKAKGNETT